MNDSSSTFGPYLMTLIGNAILGAVVGGILGEFFGYGFLPGAAICCLVSVVLKGVQDIGANK